MYRCAQLSLPSEAQHCTDYRYRDSEYGNLAELRDVVRIAGISIRKQAIGRNPGFMT